MLPVSFPSPTGQLEAGSREHRKCWTAWFNPSYQLSPPALTLSFTSCNMFKKPLVLDGVKLWFNPKDDMKPGGTSRMCCVLSPLRPSTIKAAKPFVNWESESARIIALSSITSTEIQTFEPSEIYAKLCDEVLTCEVQPGTLRKKWLVTECQLAGNVIYLVRIQEFILIHF